MCMLLDIVHCVQVCERYAPNNDAHDSGTPSQTQSLSASTFEIGGDLGFAVIVCRGLSPPYADGASAHFAFTVRQNVAGIF